MTLHQSLALLAGFLLVVFIIFAFRHGLRVKPSGRDHHGEAIAGAGGSIHRIAGTPA